MWRRAIGTILISLIVASVSIFAGFWQLERMEQRRTFNATVSERLQQPVVYAAQIAPVGAPLPESLTWRQVSFTGSYDLANQILIRGRYLDGRYGYGVVTPLIGESGAALLVDRGWVAAGESATAVPEVPPPPVGRVSITGRLKAKDTSLGPQGAIIGLPTRAANTINPAAIAAELPYPVYGGYVELVTQEPAQSSPRPRPAPQLSQGPHLAYAVQWFFFAALALIAPVIFLRARPPEVEQSHPDGVG